MGPPLGITGAGIKPAATFNVWEGGPQFPSTNCQLPDGRAGSYSFPSFSSNLNMSDPARPQRMPQARRINSVETGRKDARVIVVPFSPGFPRSDVGTEDDFVPERFEPCKGGFFDN